MSLSRKLNSEEMSLRCTIENVEWMERQKERLIEWLAVLELPSRIILSPKPATLGNKVVILRIIANTKV